MIIGIPISTFLARGMDPADIPLSAARGDCSTNRVPEQESRKPRHLPRVGGLDSKRSTDQLRSTDGHTNGARPRALGVRARHQLTPNTRSVHLFDLQPLLLWLPVCACLYERRELRGASTPPMYVQHMVLVFMLVVHGFLMMVGAVCPSSPRRGVDAHDIKVVWWEYDGGSYVPRLSANCEQRWAHAFPSSIRARLAHILAPKGGHGLRFLGSCAYNQFPVNLMRISRLSNPKASFYLVTDRHLVVQNAYYASVLRNLSIHIRFRDELRSRPSSRAVRYEKDHRNVSLHSLQRHAPEMLSRFCEIADLARDEGFQRLLLLDSDSGLFANIRRAFMPYTEDVVTPCDMCSQNTLWTVSALQRYCDGLVTFWRQDPGAIRRLFKKFNVKDRFNDMDYLAMFIARSQAESSAHKNCSDELSSRVLAHTEPSKDNPVPSAWLPGLGLRQFGQNKLGADATCQSALELLSFTDPVTNGTPTHPHKEASLGAHSSLVAARLREEGAAVPIIHFQGPCKDEAVHSVFNEHFANVFAKGRWALTRQATRGYESWWNAWVPAYDWRRLRRLL